MLNNKYCNSINKYKRFETRVVRIGDVPLGGSYPIRIQSMTTTNTLDIASTINQSIRIIESGSEYIRITAPSIKEAEALKDIRNGLNKRGYNTPIIADIHFTPNAAELAARLIEKVRVNPGNYADRKKFKTFEYTDEEYNNEIARIYDRFSPLVKICKEYGTAMRIGTNHGSLSDRIMNRYGDTPLGMVESAMEFIRICEDHNFNNIIVSMKASNTIVMVQAYRLLVNKMLSENMNYPLHLGVTEAGEGVEGRVKSSIGIGTLLEDGLGDTIRVSLTEDPEHEIPVAKSIVERYRKRSEHKQINNQMLQSVNPFNYLKRSTYKVENIGDENVPCVISDLSYFNKINSSNLSELGYFYSELYDKWTLKDTAVDYVYVGANFLDFKTPEQLGIIVDYSTWNNYSNKNNIYPLFNKNEFILNHNIKTLKFIKINCEEDIDKKLLTIIKSDKNTVLIIETNNIHCMPSQRNFVFNLINMNFDIPVILKGNYCNIDFEKIQLYASIDFGGLFVDGIGDGICISHTEYDDIKKINDLSFNILQSTRTRVTSTEFISCPSCGRTQFDLQQTTAKIRDKTSHLKGLKIAIMGCIVNGPGEMADADYGYVGTGLDKVSLYKKHSVVKKNVDSNNALNELINIIKDNNDWIEPKEKI